MSDPTVQLAHEVPLAPLTTFEVGGPAEHLLVVDSGESLGRLATTGQLPEDIALLLGGGSNVLISDDGVRGTVVVLRRRGLEPADVWPAASGRVVLDGALDWPSVATHLASSGWSGVETLVGIPGTVGAAVVQNIGAYGYEVESVVEAVRAVDLTTGRPVEMAPSEMGFRYRGSRFKHASNRLAVVSVRLRLREEPHRPRYEELRRELRGRNGEADTFPPADVAAAVLRLRERKSMVWRPGDPQTRGAGSFFKNPELDEDHLARLGEQAPGLGGCPRWSIGGRVRLSAGWLVESVGFPRGSRHGNVALCDRHALGIVNLHGEATAREIQQFAGMIFARVRDEYGIELVPEPVLVGLDFPPG